MKLLLTALFTILLLTANAQTRKTKKSKAKVSVFNYEFVIGKIVQTGTGKPTYAPITDTIKITDINEKKKLLFWTTQVENNGTNDMAKCFIPRHTLQLYNNKKLIKTYFVCFECDGIKIENYEKNKDYEKKVCSYKERMEQLKTIANFYNKHYTNETITVNQSETP